MIPFQHTEEILSISYVTSVVSHFGHTYSKIENDYGTDGCVRKIKRNGNSYIDLGTKFDCQLKASINWEIKQNSVIYDMKADAYNRLVIRNNEADTPCLLILLCLPKNKSEWISIDADSFEIKNCCYYIFIDGETTTNSDNKRIFIPGKNIFNTENLAILFDDFEKATKHE